MSRTKSRMKAMITVACTAALFLLPQAQAQGNEIVPGNFRFKFFQVPNQFTLSVEAINRSGEIVGYYQTGTASSPGPIRGFELFNRNLQTLIDPLDVENSTDPFGGVTQAQGVNDKGLVVGEFWDTAAGHYAGFLLFNGNYATYNVPGYFNTSVLGINNGLIFCGLVQTSAPDFFTSGFVNNHGSVTVFAVPGATFTEAGAINNLGEVVGTYIDTNNVSHGFIRDSQGNLTFPIDVPGASTTPGFGTVMLGVNDGGTISGHFFDASNNEHGFVRHSDGSFLQIDVPGAAQTAGGGLNNSGVVVGHWVDQSGNQIGYIAMPD